MHAHTHTLILFIIFFLLKCHNESHIDYDLGFFIAIVSALESLTGKIDEEKAQPTITKKER